MFGLEGIMGMMGGPMGMMGGDLKGFDESLHRVHVKSGKPRGLSCSMPTLIPRGDGSIALLGTWLRS